MSEEQQTYTEPTQQQTPVVVQLQQTDPVVDLDTLDEVIRQVAEQTAHETVTESVEYIGETSQLLASDAATTAADGVAARMAEEQAAADGGESVTQTVVIDSAQWAYMQKEMQLTNTLLVFTLLMCCAVLGSLLASTFVERWRR
jgi:hypothetical protein